MTEEIKSVDAKVDELEAAAKKYASKDTVISIGGYEFTPAKLMVAFTIVSSTLGGLYGAFEVYKDYMGMKKKIAEYVAPDLTEFDKRIAIIDQKIKKTEDSVNEANGYTRDIKNDLKSDLRRNETVTEQVERYVKDAQRQSDSEMREMRKGVREDLDKARSEAAAVKQEMAQARREISAETQQVRKEITAETQQLKKEVTKEVEVLKKELDQKIQRAIDNPLANK
jgi:DNA polymerase III alpha subunit (gram-positive type)